MEGQADVARSMKLPVLHISTEQYLYGHIHLQSQLISQSQLIWSRSMPIVGRCSGTQYSVLGYELCEGFAQSFGFTMGQNDFIWRVSPGSIGGLWWSTRGLAFSLSTRGLLVVSTRTSITILSLSPCASRHPLETSDTTSIITTPSTTSISISIRIPDIEQRANSSTEQMLLRTGSKYRRSLPVGCLDEHGDTGFCR
eukprot:scaffold2818_cov35-Attheya_sp.AAC.1